MAPIRSSLARTVSRLLGVDRDRDTSLRGFPRTSRFVPKVQFTIKRYSTSNVIQSTTPYEYTQGDAPGNTFTHTVAGYYTLEVDPASASIDFQMWAWGAGGGTSQGPGPGLGGAGGGVRGTSTFSAGNTITFLVGGGGGYDAATDNLADSFPNGGSVGEANHHGPGGGRSSIFNGVLPYPNRDSTSNTFLLIGGGGGGGDSFLDGGTQDGRGGYPSGFPGGAYYPKDSASGFGGGGTQSTGGVAGAAGRGPVGNAGAQYQGGDGYGGGGGDGFYGGGGAGGFYASGGGGSGYIHPSLTNTASFTQPGTTNHYVAVDDPANPGTKPAAGGDSGPTAANGGTDGVVVFKIL